MHPYSIPEKQEIAFSRRGGGRRSGGGRRRSQKAHRSSWGGGRRRHGGRRSYYRQHPYSYRRTYWPYYYHYYPSYYNLPYDYTNPYVQRSIEYQDGSESRFGFCKCEENLVSKKGNQCNDGFGAHCLQGGGCKCVSFGDKNVGGCLNQVDGICQINY